MYRCLGVLLLQGSLLAADLVDTLSLEQKIGQLFVIPVCPLGSEAHFAAVERLIREEHIGGVILKQGTIASQVACLERLQKQAPLPLLRIADAEWGLGMRLTDVPNFPKNLTLGAIQDLELLFLFGQEVGRQCRLAGIDLNLAPVADVNSNPKNPIIHMRSFGDDPQKVAEQVTRVVQGMQSEGVLACAKHFPGHGDVTVDSHVALPIVQGMSEALIPFRAAIAAGVSAVLSAHLYVEEIQEIATFSPFLIQEVLRTQLGFEGLVVTDALNMQALAAFSPEEIALKALSSGHDLLLYGDHIAPQVEKILLSDVPRALLAIKRAVQEGHIPEALIDAHVRRILRAKEKQPPPSCSPEAHALNRRLYRAALTLLADAHALLPLRCSHCFIVSRPDCAIFEEKLSQGLSLSPLDVEEEARAGDIVLFPLIAAFPPAIDKDTASKMVRLQERGVKTVAILFGTPYALPLLPDTDALLVAYEPAELAQEAAADALLGHFTPSGCLPVHLKRF